MVFVSTRSVRSRALARISSGSRAKLAEGTSGAPRSKPRPVPGTGRSVSSGKRSYARYARKVKCSAPSHWSSFRPSASSSASIGGGCASSWLQTWCNADCIFDQSLVAARTSASTLCRSSCTASSAASFVSRSTSMCTHDSRSTMPPPSGDASSGARPISSPVAVRRTRMIGWTTRWMPRSRRSSAIVTESTTNGMSSFTMSITVWPCSGAVTLMIAVPRVRQCASRQWASARSARVSTPSEARSVVVDARVVAPGELADVGRVGVVSQRGDAGCHTLDACRRRLPQSRPYRAYRHVRPPTFTLLCSGDGRRRRSDARARARRSGGRHHHQALPRRTTFASRPSPTSRR